MTGAGLRQYFYTWANEAAAAAGCMLRLLDGITLVSGRGNSVAYDSPPRQRRPAAAATKPARLLLDGEQLRFGDCRRWGC